MCLKSCQAKNVQSGSVTLVDRMVLAPICVFACVKFPSRQRFMLLGCGTGCETDSPESVYVRS